MNDFTSQVQPDTKALIWLTHPELDPASVHYRNFDYLCDGILTSSLGSLQDKTSLVLVGKNFGSSLMIFVARALVKKELESFLNLVPEVDAEILVVDDGKLMDELKGLIPDKTFKRLRKVN